MTFLFHLVTTRTIWDQPHLPAQWFRDRLDAGQIFHQECVRLDAPINHSPLKDPLHGGGLHRCWSQVSPWDSPHLQGMTGERRRSLSVSSGVQWAGCVLYSTSNILFSLGSQLLMPHFRYTLHINTGGRKSLFGSNGALNEVPSFTSIIMELSSGI